MLMQDFGTTVIHVTPSYAFYFADFLEKKGIDPRKDLTLAQGVRGRRALHRRNPEQDRNRAGH